MQHLIDSAGAPGIVSAACEVDQVYAGYQEFLELNHPHGGQDHYLRDSLLVPLDQHMETLARTLITEEGCELDRGAEEVAEALSDGVLERAPIEWNDLKRSGHPTVTHDGETVYDRAPEVGRLTEEQLRAKHLHHGTREEWDHIRRSMNHNRDRSLL